MLLAAACINPMVGDALLTIRGHLAVQEARAALRCDLRLSPIGEDTPEPIDYYRRTVGLDFSENFTVEPAVKEYRVSIACPGHDVVERVVQSTRSEARIDLGSIAPVPKK